MSEQLEKRVERNEDRLFYLEQQREIHQASIRELRIAIALLFINAAIAFVYLRMLKVL